MKHDDEQLGNDDEYYKKYIISYFKNRFLSSIPSYDDVAAQVESIIANNLQNFQEFQAIDENNTDSEISDDITIFDSDSNFGSLDDNTEVIRQQKYKKTIHDKITKKWETLNQTFGELQTDDDVLPEEAQDIAESELRKSLKEIERTEELLDLAVDSQLTKERSLKEGFETYYWKTSEDGDVRESHQELNNTLRIFGEGLEPGQEYGCRCKAKPAPFTAEQARKWNKENEVLDLYKQMMSSGGDEEDGGEDYDYEEEFDEELDSNEELEEGKVEKSEEKDEIQDKTENKTKEENPNPSQKEAMEVEEKIHNEEKAWKDKSENERDIARKEALDNFKNSGQAERNKQEAKNMYWTEWYNSVRNGGQWDPKHGGKNPEMEHAGNFNYGSTGRAVGFSEEVLLRGAGWAQERAGTSKPEWGHWYGDAPYGDDPRDQAKISEGYGYFDDEYGESYYDRIYGGWSW